MTPYIVRFEKKKVMDDFTITPHYYTPLLPITSSIKTTNSTIKISDKISTSKLQNFHISILRQKNINLYKYSHY